MSYTDVDKPVDYFNTVLYTGNGSTQSISGVGFAGDWFWFKERSVSGNHQILDSVRSSFTKNLITNSTGAEGTTSTYITSVNSDGFALGTNNAINQSGVTNVAWCWLADNTTGSSNSDGSITSTVSVNQTAGFSIVSYTSTGSNATVGHGLNAVPGLMIIKRRSGDTENWVVYHKFFGATKFVKLNSTDAVSTSSTRFNNTEPTSSVFSVGTSGDTNGGTSPFIAYCFVEKQGYSKFGNYTGNGNSNGAFVYTGFKPAFVIVKMYEANSNGNWTMHDNKRPGYNPTNKTLYPGRNYSEDTGLGRGMELFSNGFKFTGNDEGNTTDQEFIFWAFAENPFVSSSGVPTTGR